MRHAILSTTILAIMITASARSSAQETVFAEDSEQDHWTASAVAGFNSPFASDEFSVSWKGRHAFMATLEYYPTASASFGLFMSHATFDHTARTPQGPAECMRGITRGQTGLGLISRVHAVRWNGLSLVLGGSVGAANVTRQRPLLRTDGSAYGIVDLASSLDLMFGGTFGIEAVVAPGTSISVEAGYEGIENQVVLNETIVARTSIRLSL